MKNKRLPAIALCLMLLISLLVPSVPGVLASEPSDWATAEVDDANTSGLLTTSAARDFEDDLTRDEFCEIVVVLVERVLGKPLPIPSQNPFHDCENIYVLKAWQYGIIKGVSATEFDPDEYVERQQLCVMMIRAIRQMEKDLGKTLLSPGARTLTYDDADWIEDYAIEAVKLANTNGIMIGDEDNCFNPDSSMQSQECVVVVIRTYNRIERAITSGMSTSQLLDLAEKRIHIGYAYGETADGVSEDVKLPRTSTGGSTVTWASSNNSVISPNGDVNADAGVQTVTLTATIRLGGQSRTKAFTLRTSRYTGEDLQLENAYSALNIIYVNTGDSASSVTGRIGLPLKVLDLPVIWTSANPSIISETGIVHVPAGNNSSSVTMTALISNDYASKVKTFSLTVVNKSVSVIKTEDVALHKVEFGMSPSQVAQLLGTPERVIQAGNNEVWRLYHNNYSNFIAVAFTGDGVTAVFSMASGVSSQLRNGSGSIISVSAADALGGVSATSFTDGTQQYAIYIYDESSSIGNERALYAEGQEQLLFEFINAFRVRSGRTAVLWSERLGIPSRDHSEEMGQYNYYSATSRNGRSLQQRAADEGFDRSRFSSGNVLAGENDAIWFFHKMVGTSTMRSNILSSGLTVFGAGFSGGHTGTYRNYVTYMFGSLTEIISITATQDLGGSSQWQPGGGSSIIAISPGATATVYLTVTPSGYNESFTITSSNQYIMTVTRISSATTLSVYGVRAGDADIVITCNSSGQVFHIPVIVDTVYASSLALSYENTTLTNSFFDETSQIELVMGTESNLTISALTGISGTVVKWAVVADDTGGASVNQLGVVSSGKNRGSLIVTATVETSPYTSVTHSVFVNVYGNPVVNNDVDTLDSSGKSIYPKDTTARIVYTEEIAGADVKSWSSSNVNVVTVGAPLPLTDGSDPAIIGSATIVTAVNKSSSDLKANVNFTASWTTGKLRGKITGSDNITAIAVGAEPTKVEIHIDGKNATTHSVKLAGGTAVITLKAVVSPTDALVKDITWIYDKSKVTLYELSDKSEVLITIDSPKTVDIAVSVTSDAAPSVTASVKITATT